MDVEKAEAYQADMLKVNEASKVKFFAVLNSLNLPESSRVALDAAFTHAIETTAVSIVATVNYMIASLDIPVPPEIRDDFENRVKKLLFP